MSRQVCTFGTRSGSVVATTSHSPLEVLEAPLEIASRRYRGIVCGIVFCPMTGHYGNLLGCRLPAARHFMIFELIRRGEFSAAFSTPISTRQISHGQLLHQHCRLAQEPSRLDARRKVWWDSATVLHTAVRSKRMNTPVPAGKTSHDRVWPCSG
jgi:hypothetical protein